MKHGAVINRCVDCRHIVEVGDSIFFCLCKIGVYMDPITGKVFNDSYTPCLVRNHHLKCIDYEEVK